MLKLSENIALKCFVYKFVVKLWTRYFF